MMLNMKSHRPAFRPAEWSLSSYRISSISNAARIVSTRTVALIVPWLIPSLILGEYEHVVP